MSRAIDYSVGDTVCGCDCKHHVVAIIDLENDIVEMVDGINCSVFHCGVELAKEDGSCHSAYV